MPISGSLLWDLFNWLLGSIQDINVCYFFNPFESSALLIHIYLTIKPLLSLQNLEFYLPPHHLLTELNKVHTQPNIYYNLYIYNLL